MLATIQIDEIATGSFKLDACRGPEQVHFKAWSEDLKKVRLYQKSKHSNVRKKIYQILRRSTTNSRYAFLKFKLSGLS